MSQDDEENRIVIPVHDGFIPPLPCMMANAGTHEHGSTFTKNNFHYQCNNGTAEVIACISDDGAVVQLGRTYVNQGVRHKCNVQGDSVTYEQEAMCFENGIHYEIGDSFRNGSFKLTCRKEGIVIEGCYLQSSLNTILMPGESRIVDGKRHECQDLGPGKVRYTVKMLGCVRDGQQFGIGQLWTDKHVRYRCQNDGTLEVLGCVDDDMYIDLGRDLLISGMVHRCYQVDNTTFYHKFACDEGRTLAECIAHSIAMKARRFHRS
ncbi:hypothetical protein WR25_17313 [Diploscapter pachys]|uniref:Abnormal cell migration protein 18-like fibronectin type I domain-containing protein n=1 Tax=Diploscapter pachys TaxID=2018661 RepID=A0A2A2L6U9_9BILA|nr:hypothetical protein WR25_17313 [Diploscapter pachys]